MKFSQVKILISILILSLTAQDARGQLTELKIKSTILQEQIEVWIKTPADYQKTTTSFPVLYVLDADGLFHLAANMNAYLSLRYVEHMPAMIVVGIRSKSPAWRNKFFNLPDTDTSDTNHVENFQLFLEKELKPEIAKLYRTADFSIIAGHSLGGLFVTHSLASKPGAFNGYIAISPTLYRHLTQLDRKIKMLTLDKPTFYYFSAAEHDLANYQPLSEKLRDSLTRYSIPNLEWSYSFSKGKDHYTTAPASLYEHLAAIFEPWYTSDSVNPITLDMILNHADVLSKRYGYDINTESKLAMFGEALLANGRIESAKRTFDALSQRYPSSPVPYHCLANYYLVTQDKSKAKMHMYKTIKIMKNIKSPDLDEALELKRAIEKMNPIK